MNLLPYVAIGKKLGLQVFTTTGLLLKHLYFFILSLSGINIDIYEVIENNNGLYTVKNKIILCKFMFDFSLDLINIIPVTAIEQTILILLNINIRERELHL